MQRYVDEDILAGVSSAVFVGRELVDLNCVGWADKEARIPLRMDHIFRVFSNTKLIASCAALLLWEQKRFALDDAIELYIPQLAHRRVLLPNAKSLAETEPVKTPITIRQLLSHSAGIGCGFLGPDALIVKAYDDSKIASPSTSLAEMIEGLVDLPLMYHPGTSWEYSYSLDVVARLIEIISKQPFDKFLRERIFEPLGMKDTGFVVPETSRGRFAALYAGVDTNDHMRPGLIRTDDMPYPDAFVKAVARFDASGGLVSTLPDMMALIKSLLPGGPTLLKPETIKLMMTNQLAKNLWQKSPTEELPGYVHGLAGGLVQSPPLNSHPSSAGEFYWGGYAGTQWWISPNTNSAGVMMMQRQLAFAHPAALEFKRLTYEALTSSH